MSDGETKTGPAQSSAAKKPVGRPKKYRTEAERKNAKRIQNRAYLKRTSYRKIRERNAATGFADQLKHHQSTGYAAQKLYRVKQQKQRLLERTAALATAPVKNGSQTVGIPSQSNVGPASTKTDVTDAADTTSDSAMQSATASQSLSPAF